MLVQVFRHSEAQKQGDKPKYQGEFLDTVRSPQGYDVALILKEDGTMTTEDFDKLVVQREPAVTKPVIAETPAKPSSLEQKDISKPVKT